MRDHKRNRPGVGPEAAPKSLAGDYPQYSNADTLPADHALLVTRTIKGGGHRRNVMFSLPSAHKAVARAEAAGHVATITLVVLRPVGHATLDFLDLGGPR